MRRRLVVGPGDLLDDDAALAVELIAVDPGRATKSVSRSAASSAASGAGGDVEGDQVVARVGVEHRADALRRLVDVTVGGVLLAALEHEVLEEMGHPVLLGTLGAGAGVEGGQDRHRAGPLHRDPVTAAARCPGWRSRSSDMAKITVLHRPEQASPPGHVGVVLTSPANPVASACETGSFAPPRRYAARTLWLPHQESLGAPASAPRRRPPHHPPARLTRQRLAAPAVR